ncbi:hypothetical protein [Rickettsia endosymbiont of Polydrusus tereticollis]|uniref:hypothetical protein n=1 Tax=Rickettsia endosymbiont of Polydrusus tereticollis TaxID=3066251 RepID=UPI00313333A6
MQEVLNLFSIDNQQQHIINYVKNRLIECIPKDDIISAIAITNCAVGATGISAKNFDLHFIEKLAIQNDHNDFALSFIGCCNALHYFD